jgi:hypothetical protein
MMKSPAGRYLFSRFMAGPSRVSVEWELAIVDPLLVARFDAKSLLGRAGRLIVALIGIVVLAALDRGLLRARRERPSHRAAEQRDQLAPV